MSEKIKCPLTPGEIENIISLDGTSGRKQRAREGERYYESRNDILNHRIFYFDGDGELVEDKFSSNIRTPHGFYKELVDQKVSYLIDPGAFHVTSQDGKLNDALEERFGYDFNAELMDLCTDASKGGFGYVYAFVDEEGVSRFKAADALGVIEVRQGSATGPCDAVIYRYVDHVGYDRKEVERVMVWDKEWVWHFVKEGEGTLKFDEGRGQNPQPHKQWTDPDLEGTYYAGFGQIPFWRLDNNRKQVPDLAPVKAIIDDYDLMKCGLSNNLQDLTEGFFVVKGYQGDDATLTEMITNFRKKRQIGVSEEGGVEIQTVQIPYEARKANMEIDEKNVYRFGMGLNTAGLKDTAATTNMAIKAAYALLDLKCNGFEVRLKALMRDLVQFALEEINEELKSGYTLKDVDIEFERVIMTNATDNAQTELIEAQAEQTKAATLLNVAAQFGSEGVLDEICALLDLDPEKVNVSLGEPADGGLSGAVAALGADGVPSASQSAAIAEKVTGKTLNGAQTNALIGVIQQYSQGSLTYDQAASVIKMSIGCTIEEAKDLLGEVS